MDKKIEIVIGDEDSQMVLEEIALDVEAEDLNVTLGVNREGNIIASGPEDSVRALVTNVEFVERFFGGVSLKTVLNLIYDDAYEITGNCDRLAEARHAVKLAKASN